MDARPISVLLVGITLVMAGSAFAEVPWPFGRPPSPSHIEALRRDAERLFLRGRDDEGGLRVAAEELEALGVEQLRLDQQRQDPKDLFLRGDELFELAFSRAAGFGGVIDPGGLRRVHSGRKGGLDTFSCAGCHSMGGPDGAGTFAQNAHVMGDGQRASSANLRNPPSLLGVGLVQALGVEMSAELQRGRAAGVEQARAEGKEVTVELRAKGVRFGELRIRADGSVDTKGVEGVDADLIVKPFGWKGETARLRRMVEEAARVHFGVQSSVLAERGRERPDPDALGPGERWYDPDGDGIERELPEGALTVGALYLAMLETPVIVPPHDPGLVARWVEGDAIFSRIGCDACHLRMLRVDNRIWEEAPDTTGGAPITINLLADGEEPRGNDQAQIFSDLKRHAMGERLADNADSPSGIGRDVFLTRPLWGLAESGPYLHDGSAATIDEAIEAHGGEARAARDAHATLSAEEKGSLRVFLSSLSRAPKPRFAR